MENCNCDIFLSLSDIENIDNSIRICTNCDVFKRYKELVNCNKINIVNEITKFNTKKHQIKKGGSNNASGNKCNIKRNLSKSRKKFKNKSN